MSKSVDRTPLTLPILAVLFGVAIGPDGLAISGLADSGETVGLLAEFTLALVLFYDAARIDLRLLRKNLGVPERLLGPGLILTVLLGFALGVPLLGRDFLGGSEGLGLWEIALVAALLAPTDAALGQAVVTQKTVPLRVRQALNVESGLNDGLIVPVVAVLMACSIGASAAVDSGPWTWVRHAAEAAGYGVGVGVLIGLIAARALDIASQRDWMHHGAKHIAVAAVPVLAFFVAEELHGSGFLAAFVAGLALGSTTRRPDREFFTFTENTGELLGLLTWIIFGVAAAPAALSCATPAVIGYALLSLTVIRMLPVAIALRGTKFNASTVLFLGWFGPRGLATVVFALAVLEESEIAGAERIFGVAVWTVLLSVLLHGMTAGALARRYGALCDSRAQEDGGLTAAEALPVPEHPAPQRR